MLSKRLQLARGLGIICWLSCGFNHLRTNSHTKRYTAAFTNGHFGHIDLGYMYMPPLTANTVPVM